LKRQGLVQIDRRGIRLSDLGKHVLSTISLRISGSILVPKSSITIGDHNYAILVRDSLSLLKNGIEQRDAAVKSGALGATTLYFKDNKLQMLGIPDDTFIVDPSLQKLLIEELRPQENDVIIIASAKEATLARIGAKIAALELFRKK
jgi:hypothetical protein